MNEIRTVAGRPLPLGMHRVGESYNFAVFSRHATGLSLLLFNPDEDIPSREFRLDPLVNRTGDVWHIGLIGAHDDQTYALRLDGAFAPENGHRFDPTQLLLDPYASSVVERADGRFRAGRARKASAPAAR